MVIFYEFEGKCFRQVCSDENAIWIVDYDTPSAPREISQEGLCQLKPIPVPESYLDESDIIGKRKLRMEKRLEMLEPMIADNNCITDKKYRHCLAQTLSGKYGISIKTIYRLYYAYLAKGERGLAPAARVVQENETTDKNNMAQALSRYFYSPRKMSLQSTYEMMLLDFYRNDEGKISKDCPTFYQFKHYYYSHQNIQRKLISRKGIGDYQKNYRPLLGKGDSGVNFIGAYELDATEADIYIVSRYNRKPIGRPIVYLAVDIVSRLVAGIYVGLEVNSNSVLACLSNAARDKVEYCSQYGIEITKEMWPSQGLPGVIYTDRGSDFISGRVKELCHTFGMEVVNLPAYRPDLKGFVEKAFDCIQKKFKPALYGKGIVEPVCREQGGPDYYQQATIDLDEFTKILIQCVLYYNSGYNISDYIRSPEMSENNIAPIASEIWKWKYSNGEKKIINAEDEVLHLMMLARDKAKMTRKGVYFMGLYYQSEKYKNEFVRAGIEGQNTVDVAYDPLDNSSIYLVENGVYQLLTLTLASKQLTKLSYEETRVLLQYENEAYKRGQERQTEASVTCAGEIRKIVQKAESVGLHEKRDTRSSAMREQRELELRRREESGEI